MFRWLGWTLAMVAATPLYTQIKSGSAIYIQPMGGYETSLTSEIMKRHLPLVVVTDITKADYVIAGTVEHKDTFSPESPSVVINNTNASNPPANPYTARAQQLQDERWAEIRALGMTHVSITITDSKTSRVLFADSEDASGKKQMEKLAESCVKRLRVVITK